MGDRQHNRQDLWHPSEHKQVTDSSFSEPVPVNTNDHVPLENEKQDRRQFETGSLKRGRSILKQVMISSSGEFARRAVSFNPTVQQVYDSRNQSVVSDDDPRSQVEHRRNLYASAMISSDAAANNETNILVVPMLSENKVEEDDAPHFLSVPTSAPIRRDSLDGNTSRFSSLQRRFSFNILPRKLSLMSNHSSKSSGESTQSSVLDVSPSPRRRLSSFRGMSKYENDYEVDPDPDMPTNDRRRSSLAPQMVAQIKLFETDHAEKEFQPRRISAAKTTSSSMSIGRSKFPHAQEVSETFSTKLIAIKYLILSVLLNIVLLLLAVFMGQGLEVPFSPRFANITFGVAVEAVILITNILTLKTLDLGVAIFISMLMTNRSGYGLVSCGFIQAKPLERLQYAQSLSLNSTCRKTLERVAYLWILLELLKALSPFAATDVFNMPIRTLSGSVNCIVFDANPSKTTDRTYPTLESSSGTAEFLFGRALGCMRSERGDCGEGSLFAFGPQLDGAVNDGDAVAGEGFAMKIATHCQCMDISLPEAVTQGYLTMKDQAIVLDWVQKGLPYPFLVLMQNMNITGNSFLSTTVLGGAQTCGGYSMFVLPVCTTNISSFENAMIVSSYATDGTTASIALVASDIYGNSTNSRSAITSQDIRNALAAILPPSAPYELVPNIPGLGNALMWWMSTDLRAFDPTLLPQGMETMYAVILRAGIQRTFNTFGSSCLREVFRNDATTVSFNTRGTLTVYVIGGLQLLISAFSFLLASVWFFSPSPLGPAIRIVTQPMYFISLLCESPFWFNLQGTGNAQSHVMWQQLDTIARIGESLDTLDEPIGRLRIDRPRLVKSLANGRIYA